MIDTVKIQIPFSCQPKWVTEARLFSNLDATKGVFVAYNNPSSSYKKLGIYQPRLTYTERPKGNYIKSYQLAIEFSAPKLLFNNNFTELKDTDFDAVIEQLKEVLRKTYGVWLFPHQLAKAQVGKIDYSKNIVFDDHTPVSTITEILRKADISRRYDTQHTDFKNGGHVYHIHTNALDIAFYDKVADLRQTRVSEKRSYEKNGYTQLNLLDELEKQRTVSVARLEIRINGVAKLRKELNVIGVDSTDLTFRHLFSTDTSRKVLLRHWKNIFDELPKAPFAVIATVEQNLIAYKQAYPYAKPAETSFAVMLAMIRKDHADERYVRNVIEELFGKHVYYRYKRCGRSPPTQTQLKTLLHIEATLTEMKPVSIDDYTL
jgi:hypothetical protein